MVININDEMEKLAKEFEKLWEKNYYKRNKYDIICKWVEKKKKEGWKIHTAKKAISTHIDKWLGWRRARDGRVQYCVRLYGGYVFSLIFDEISKKVKE